MHRPGPAAAVALVAAVVALCIPMLALPAAAAEPEWNIDRIGAPASGAGTVIAVVDTGVDAAHPVFGGRVQPAIDLLGGDGGDPNGHGTHVAGVAAGADSGCGAIGVAPDATILPVRVLDEDGEGTVDVVAEGIRRAADRGAAVINLSLGADVVLWSESGAGLEEPIRYAWSKGSIPVLAAGNDGIVGGIFGSGYGDIPAVVVTATDHRDRAPSYATSIGSAEWGVAAPGGDGSGVEGRDILSAYPARRCALHAGTSMAAPHVSGALAALRSSGLTPQQAVDRLLSTARPIGSASTYGHGLIDLRAALGAPPRATATTVAASPPAPPASAPTSTAGAPSPAPRSDQPAASDEPTDPGPTTTVALAPDVAAPADADDGTEAPPSTTPRPRPDLAAPVVVGDADRGGGGDLPPALVALAAVSAAASGAAAGWSARSLRRR